MTGKADDVLARIIERLKNDQEYVGFAERLSGRWAKQELDSETILEDAAVFDEPEEAP